MRVMRTSLYAPDQSDGVHVIVRDRDLSVPLETAQERSLTNVMLVISDIFEMRDGSLEDAIQEAMERLSERHTVETHMTTLYYYVVGHLPRVVASGVILMPSPAPLTVEDIEVTFKQLLHHPAYTNQTLTAIARDSKVISLRDGEIKVGGNLADDFRPPNGSH